jgi:hypothetical protein
LTGGGGVVQDAPVRIELTSGEDAIELTPTDAAPALLEAADDRVVMRGSASAGEWRLTTTTETEFDGLITVTATLDGPTDRRVDRFRIDIPLRVDNDPMVGFWAGNPWFRGACDYRALPVDQGVVFASNATQRGQPEGWQDRVSFLPYLAISDSDRGLCWLAENDRNWSQSWEHPAQQIIRDGKTLWLRLNVVNDGDPMSMTEPLEYTFCLQTTPVRPASMIDREFMTQFNFAMVDGFNGQLITAAMGSHAEFRLSPENGDWDAVAPRADAARRVAPFRTSLMYLDHTWQRAPEDAQEYQSDWRGWGGATAYTQPVRDCMAWYQHEYLRRGLVDGFYIDDCWIKPTKSHAPAYTRNGEREWGFDFLGFRQSLKRLRWLFHEQGKQPKVAVHVTQTLYYPLFVFADLMVDGEDRFPPWGLKRDFISRWGSRRIRYASATASGVPTVWMNAIGNKQESPGPMGGWVYREARSFVGLCAVSDVWPLADSTHRYTRSLQEAGVGLPAARFTGYWAGDNPLRPLASSTAVLASVYTLPEHLAVVMLNTAKEERVAEFTIDAAAIAKVVGSDWVVVDADPFDPPTEKDLTDFRRDADGLEPTSDAEAIHTTVESAETLAMLEDVETEIQEEADRAAGPHPELDAHNATVVDGVLRARIRARDYRVLIIRKAE